MTNLLQASEGAVSRHERLLTSLLGRLHEGHLLESLLEPSEAANLLSVPSMSISRGSLPNLAHPLAAAPPQSTATYPVPYDARLSGTPIEDSPLWMELFIEYFIRRDQPWHDATASPVSGASPEATPYCTGSDDVLDDLLFFVRRAASGRDALPGGLPEERVFVRRKQGKGLLPPLDDLIDWRETLLLNLISQLYSRLCVSICKRNHAPKTGAPDEGPASTSKQSPPPPMPAMTVLHQFVKRVYAAPNKTRLEDKGRPYEGSYPLIYFTLEDFEDHFGNILIAQDEYLCVELIVSFQAASAPPEASVSSETGRDRVMIPGVHAPNEVALFQGAVSHQALTRVFQSKSILAGHQGKKKGGTSAPLFGEDEGQQTQFILMRGPHGKGHAQVAVRPHPPPSSPMSSPYSKSSSTASSLSWLQSLKSFASSSSSSAAAGPEAVSGVSVAELKLKCCMTFVNVPWQSILSDLAAAYIRSLHPLPK